jgi:RNA 2',3'-cyclic 3'-phosphodiesterase
MRLFTAIDIPEEIRETLRATVSTLKPAAKLRWSKPENLHITTKFLGEVPAERLSAVVNVLGAMPASSAIPIEVRGIGWFPNPHAPRILYAGIQAPEWLAQLHLRTDEALAGLGVPKETKPFRPHLTLARIDGKVELADLRHAIFALPGNQFGAFMAERFHLDQSETGGAGSVYTRLADFSI